MEPISDPLRRALLADGRTIAELAGVSGVDTAALYRFKNRQRSLTLPSADGLARVLGLELRPTRARKKRR